MASPDTNSKDFIKRLQDGKTRRAAFEILVSQYSQQMYWKARHIVTRHEDADDVVQNAFIKAWTKIDDFRGDSAVSTWLYRICVNESLDLLRKKREQLDDDATMNMAKSMYADEYFDGDEAEVRLQKAVATLPEAQRATFLLRYYEDMPYKEMSDIMGTSIEGLKTNYHLAVKKIKEFLTKKD